MNKPSAPQPPQFAAANLLADEIAIHLVIDILTTSLEGFGTAFVSECDKLLRQRLPIPDAQRALQTLRDHVDTLSQC